MDLANQQHHENREMPAAPDGAHPVKPLARWLHRATILMLVLFSILTGALAASSLRWRMAQDTPLLHYGAFLMHQHDRMPYRDFFETSMPGSFLFHYAVIEVAGLSEFRFRVIDIALLCLLCGAIFRIMRPFGFLAAWMAMAGFAHIYLAFGPAMGLQRDYLGVLALAGALLFVPRTAATRIPLGWRYAVAGFFFGLAALVKPHLALGAPVVFLMMVASDARGGFRRLALGLVMMAAGGALPVATVILWMHLNGMLDDFLFLVMDYLPLHQSLTGNHQVLTDAEWIRYLLNHSIRMFGLQPVFFAACAGAIIALLRRSEPRHLTTGLAVLLIGYTLYPTIAAKFWDYHYIPFCFAAALASSLLLAESRAGPGSGAVRNLFGVLAILLAVHLVFPFEVSVGKVRDACIDRIMRVDARVERADRVAKWLRTRTAPGSTIQPVDWTDGLIHAMLMSESKLATRFLYDYHFAHHISSPVTQRLRREFAGAITTNPPDYFIVAPKRKRVTGPDTSELFPELNQLILDRYEPVNIQADFEIYRRP